VHASRLTIVAGTLVTVAVIIGAIVLLTGDSSDDPDTNTAAQYQNYHQAQFAAAITNSWPENPSDRRVGNYLESSWSYPLNPAATFTVYSRTSDETGSPAATAELARIQVDKLPSYQERGLKRFRLRENPAVRWNFDLSGATYVEYFFEECGIGLVVRASAPTPDIWRELSSSFDEMATSITANCAE
jgi:hypothetical protein